MSTSGSIASDKTVLSVRGVEKRFGPTVALRGVDLDIGKGEVHALLGHNGSGKSTLIKVLAGLFRPDSGSASVDGEMLSLGDARSAYAAGLRFVHQDRAIVGSLDAVDNLALSGGFPKRKGGLIAWRAARDRARRLFDDLGYEIDIDLPAEEMSPAMQTSLAIARALQDGEHIPRVLILDEPTSAMTSADVNRLLVVVDRLRQRGLGVIFITHHLPEAIRIADRLTILRNGEVVADRATAGVTEDEIVEIMLGREYVVGERAAIAQSHSARESSHLSERSKASGSRSPMLKVSGLSTDSLRGIDMSVGQGEVVGVAGLAGSGTEELLQAIAGARPRGGVVVVDGRELEPSKPHRAVAFGVGYVPSDRLRNGIFRGLDVGVNLCLVRLGQLSHHGFRRSRTEESEANDWFRRLGVVPAATEAPIESLSGGNQQRVLVGRWLMSTPKVIMLDEPSEGVDVGARKTVHAAVRDAAARGAAVLVSSTDSSELADLCDRVLVLSRGTLICELTGARLNADDIDAEAMSTV